MPNYCAVENCKSFSKNKNDSDIIKFFTFPKDKNITNLWIKAIGKTNINVKHKRICSLHFTDDDWRLQDRLLNVPFGKRLLKPNAIPSKMLPEHSCSEVVSMSRNKRAEKINCKKIVEDAMKESITQCILQAEDEIQPIPIGDKRNSVEIQTDNIMVGKDIDPSDIGKHPRLIKAAQQDMTQMDVLVCGKCHTVFHFIDLFKEHKEQLCIKESNFKESREQKPKVWAFLLWKAAQLNNINNKDLSGHTNSWKLYQTWVKMEESIRETWVVAGKTIQSFARMGQGNLQEMPVKITKTVVDTAPNKITPTNRLPATYNRNIIKKEENQNITDDEPSPIKTEPKKILRPSLTPISTPNQYKPTPPLTSSTPIPRLNAFNRRATRTLPGNSQETEMETVEKIVAKRFNPRRKMHEYLVKWEGFTHEQNTWEPQIHLECCGQLLETFEKQLARQKEQRAQAAAAKQQQLNTQNPIKTDDDNKQRIQQGIVPTTSTGLGSPQLRLLRTKAKVMDQVKQWIEKDEKMSTNSGLDGSESSIGGGIKRKLDDSSDFDGVNTAGEEEDFEEDAIPVHAVKRLKNGTTVTTTKVDPKSDLSKSPTIIKTINVNGTIKSGQVISDNSADVVITKDTANTGIVRKVGVSPNSNNQKPEAQIRVISKGENTTSGIVRINSTTSSNSSGTPNTIQKMITTTTGGQQRITQIVNKTPVRSNTTPQIHRITVNSKDTTSSTPTTVKSLMQQSSSSQQQLQQQKTVTQRLTPTQQVRQIQTQPRQATIIQRTSLSPNTTNMGTNSTSPQSGKMIINRKNTVNNFNNVNNTTPEQKIMQLSKTGDIKVTRKTIQSPQQQQHVQTQPKVLQMGQRRQQQPVQQQQQQQQKQMISSRSKLQQQHQSRSESPPSGLTLCPVTGKILTETGEEVQTVEKKDDTVSGVLQTQLNLQQEHDLVEGLSLAAEGQQILANEDGTPLLVTGEDGTIYQVAGKNAEGQTILIAQGADGEQQYAYVAAADEGDESNHATANNAGVLTIDNAVAEAVAQMLPDQGDQLSGQGDIGQFIIKQDDGTLVTATTAGDDVDEQGTVDPSQALTIQTDAGDSQDANIPAEVVQADLPSPGGTRRVILLLQDGTFMMTEMHDDEYQALNIT